jgi:hypothetical protein
VQKIVGLCVVVAVGLGAGCVDRVIDGDENLGIDPTRGDDESSGDGGSADDDTDRPGPGCVPPGPNCPCPPGQGEQAGQCVPLPEMLVGLSAADQTALAGSFVFEPPVVQLVASDGTPIPQTPVTFVANGSEGSAITFADNLTDNQGITTAGDWQLGKLAGLYSVTVSVPSLPNVAPIEFRAQTEGTFDITLDYVVPVTPEQEIAFDRAARRWEAIVLNAQPVVNANAVELASFCGVPAEPADLAITGVHIFVELAPIDGPGMGGVNILGSAGPCTLRDLGSPSSGSMRFDTFDLDVLAAEGKLETVILHEMGHVLGIGTLWGPLGLVVNPSVSGGAGVDTHFVGPNALAAFQEILGPILLPGEPVPVENNAQPGSADGHWRESILDNELMTPALGDFVQETPLSVLTIASLADHGYYDANMFAADPFVLFEGQFEESAGPTRIDELQYPRGITAADGTITPL